MPISMFTPLSLKRLQQPDPPDIRRARPVPPAARLSGTREPGAPPGTLPENVSLSSPETYVTP